MIIALSLAPRQGAGPAALGGRRAWLQIKCLTWRQERCLQGRAAGRLEGSRRLLGAPWLGGPDRVGHEHLGGQVGHRDGGRVVLRACVALAATRICRPRVRDGARGLRGFAHGADGKLQARGGGQGVVS
ncbi:MAG: hypothetical protein H6806_03945 [Planctomycetes bacterium]|nr:hypothetical protein [Planctomycetota bacterium]